MLMVIMTNIITSESPTGFDLIWEEMGNHEDELFAEQTSGEIHDYNFYLAGDDRNGARI